MRKKNLRLGSYQILDLPRSSSLKVTNEVPALKSVKTLTHWVHRWSRPLFVFDNFTTLPTDFNNCREKKQKFSWRPKLASRCHFLPKIFFFAYLCLLEYVLVQVLSLRNIHSDPHDSNVKIDKYPSKFYHDLELNGDSMVIKKYQNKNRF